MLKTDFRMRRRLEIRASILNDAGVRDYQKSNLH